MLKFQPRSSPSFSRTQAARILLFLWCLPFYLLFTMIFLFFFSKALNSIEQKYATNEKELFAIVWAVNTLRHYLYAVKDLGIHTDCQLLAFAVSKKTSNIRMKRLGSFIEDLSINIIYKPGTTNVVADALSRQVWNNLPSSDESRDSSDSLIETQLSAESSDQYKIHETKKPLNHFKQHIVIDNGAKISVLKRIS